MKFNDSDNKQNSLYHYALYLLGLDSSDTTSLPIADFTRSANSWFRRLAFLLWKNAYTWDFDDSNYLDLPIATTTLVDGQQDYSLPTDAIDVQRVEVLDSNENYMVLTQFDKTQITDTALPEFYETAGMPAYYDLVGNSLMLYPKPSSSLVTLSAGLQLYLSREISAFVVADTDKEPGIQAQFHSYMAYGPALDYAIAKNMDINRTSGLRNELSRIEATVQEYMNKKNKDFRVKIRPTTRGSI